MTCNISKRPIQIRKLLEISGIIKIGLLDWWSKISKWMEISNEGMSWFVSDKIYIYIFKLIYKLCPLFHLAIVQLLLPFQGSIRKAKTAARTRLADPTSSSEEMAGRQLLQKTFKIRKQLYNYLILQMIPKRRSKYISPVKCLLSKLQILKSFAQFSHILTI
jgi:hypothetical protein